MKDRLAVVFDGLVAGDELKLPVIFEAAEAFFSTRTLIRRMTSSRMCCRAICRVKLCLLVRP